MSIIINGIKYREKEQPEKKPVSKTMAALMMMAGMFDYPTPTKRKDTHNIDIVKEYELIKQKKSYLSASQRRWVISQFEKYYEPVKEG